MQLLCVLPVPRAAGVQEKRIERAIDLRFNPARFRDVEEDADTLGLALKGSRVLARRASSPELELSTTVIRLANKIHHPW